MSPSSKTAQTAASPRTTRVKRTAAVLAVSMSLGLALAGATPALAHEPYNDKDADYLNVINTFVYPIGVLLEWTIFRPIHVFESRSVSGHRTGRTSRSGTLRVARGCNTPRPPRYCRDARFRIDDK